jgi:hypothetical protein
MLNDHYEITLAKHWIPALVNLDYSGLEGNEENDLDAFMYDYWRLPDATFAVHDFTPQFATDEVSGLLADCYTCRVYFTNKETADHA